MIDFYPLHQALEAVEQNILKGKSLSGSLSEHELFDDKMIAMVKVAEETNQNEFIFQRLNTQVQQRLKLLSNSNGTYNYNDCWCIGRCYFNCYVFTNV